MTYYPYFSLYPYRASAAGLHLFPLITLHGHATVTAPSKLILDELVRSLMRELHQFELYIFIELVKLILITPVTVQCVCKGFLCF